jgi:hypothetical protein
LAIACAVLDTSECTEEGLVVTDADAQAILSSARE